MRQCSIGLLSVALFAGLIAGCSTGVEEGSPGNVVQTFYQHLNDGSYGDARMLYNEDALAVVEDPNFGSEDSYREWARVETKQGTVSRVDIVDTTLDETGAAATVAYEVVYNDGSTKSAEISLTQENGVWKVGLIL
jgi:hypothetical protein